MAELTEAAGEVTTVEHAEFFARLAEPFRDDEIRSFSKSGRTFDYVTARTVMNRLDDVCGPAGWRDEFVEMRDGMKCRLSVRLPSGEWLTKEDGGGSAGMTDSDDDEKSAYSGSFKRAAVKFGVARYLYRDGVPFFVRDFLGVEFALFYPQTQDRPSTPAPRPNRPAPARGAPAADPEGRDVGRGDPDAPRIGRALFAWVMKQEDHYGEGLLKHVNGWAKRVGLPSRMVDYDSDQVARAYAEAQRYLRSDVEVHQEAPVG